MLSARYISRLLMPQLANNTLISSQSREIKRWVAPVLREINKRKRKLGPEPIRPRSSFLEWNYNAELFAFNKRLNENFDLAKLQQAFIHQSYILQEEQKQRELSIEDPKIELEDNRKLIETGEALIISYVDGFLKFFLPKMPPPIRNQIRYNLTSQEAFAKLASNLGMGDLVLSSDFPLQTSTLADTFKAVVGSLASSSGEGNASIFVRDFVCTQLNQQDLTEWIEIQKPFEELKQVCKEANFGEPEPRLIGESAKNTVLASYHVGIYSDKKLISTGFGENIPSAIDVAAMSALREFWQFQENMKPFDFNVHLEQAAKFKLKSVS